MPRLTFAFILFMFFLGACTPQSQSDLSKALSLAVKEEKLSAREMENILNEYEMLREEDNAKAREYARKIVSAIEMGGDSSHIEVVRRQVVGTRVGV